VSVSDRARHALRWLAPPVVACAITYWHEPPPPGAEGASWPPILGALLLVTSMLWYVSRRFGRRLAKVPAGVVVGACVALGLPALWVDRQYRALAAQCIVPYERVEGSGREVELVYLPEAPVGRLAELIAESGGSRAQALDRYGPGTIKEHLRDAGQAARLDHTTAEFVVLEALFSLSVMLAAAALLGLVLPAAGEAPRPRREGAPVDFLLFAPLEEERDAVLAKLDGPRKLDGDGADVHVYFEARMATRRQDGAAYRVIVVSPAGMGPVQAAITASAATARWEPAHVLVIGIAGGLADEVSAGDVMVARSVADYTLGKVRPNGTREERWEMYPADAGLLHAANAFRAGWEDLVTERRPEGEGAPLRHVGVIATGGDVIASKDLIRAYRADMPKLIGVDMEGGGVAAALHGHPLRPGFLMIRGVSDLADGADNAETKARWRAHARDVAAAYAIGLLRDGPMKARA